MSYQLPHSRYLLLEPDCLSIHYGNRDLRVSLNIDTFYIRIYQIVRRHQIQIHCLQQAIQRDSELDKQWLDVTHVVELNAFVFYIASILCYSSAYILLTFNGPEWNFAFTVIFVNSAKNPILYFRDFAHDRGPLNKRKLKQMYLFHI